MAKKAFNIDTQVPAETTVNVLSGTRFENVGVTAVLLLAQKAAESGLLSELFVADRNSLEQSPVAFEANPVIQLPEDINVDDVECFPGERIQLRVQNITGSPIRYIARLMLDDNVMFAQ